MAAERRVARVAELIKREVGLMLLNGIKDDRVGVGMVSVTDVEVSHDLQHAKVFVSVYGTEEARNATMDGLKSATGYVRREIGHRLSLRRTPEVAFYEDQSLERGSRIIALLNQLQQQRQDAPMTEPIEPTGEDLAGEEEESDSGDPLL